MLAQISEARAGCTRLAKTLALAGIGLRTILAVGKQDGTTRADWRRDAIRPTPSHAPTACTRPLNVCRNGYMSEWTSEGSEVLAADMIPRPGPFWPDGSVPAARA